MTTPIEKLVFPDQTQLSAAAAERLVNRVRTIQDQRRVARLGLTGGRGGTGVLAAILDAPGTESVDWSAVEFWWSDERFLPQGDPERNETGAREALLDHIPLDPSRVHPMPASDGPDADVESAARTYAAKLPPTAATATVAGTSPWLDICLLGIGEDAHVASLFPGRHEAVETATVVAVHDSPKPPPTRTTFTMSVICSSDEVWLIAAGEGKAQAVQRTLAGLPLAEAPAGSARGRSHTVLFADEAAASLVPSSGG